MGGREWCSHLLMQLLVVFVCVHGQKPNSAGFINIDCGLESNTTYTSMYTGLTYVSDDQYIDTGVNGLISTQYTPNNKTVYPDFDTLRSFPNGTKNCYTLKPVTKGSKYLVRTNFYYGNYDRLSMPPSFDLYFGVNFWSTVEISNPDDWYYYEIIAIAPANYVEVCLVNTGHGNPFITTLELRPLNDSLYKLSNSKQSLNNLYRFDVGSNATHALRYPKDAHDRLWFNWIRTSWTSISTDFSIDGFEFDVPSLVLQNAVLPSAGNSINISWSADNISTTHLVVLHFSEIQKLQNNSLREFYLSANGELVFKDPIPMVYLGASYAYYTKRGYTHYNMSLWSSARATLPPILNGFEIYTILPVKFSPTYDGDVTAINTIKESYNVIKNWSGDPCVPTGLGWTGVNCTTDSLDTPRITELNLSSEGLTSEMVSAFGYLTKLQKLDLSHNNLSGKIPNSLDKLVSLTFLDLSENSKLICTLPSGLQKRLDKGLLRVNFNGTAPSVGADSGTKGKFSKTVIIIIVAVVIVVLLIIGAATLFFFCMMKHRNTPINPTYPNTSRDQTGNNHSTGTSSQGQTGNPEPVAEAKRVNFDKKQFNYEELNVITNNFSYQVGIGGFGKVFRGQLNAGKDVAVKVRTERSPQGIKQFLNEVELLSRIHHKNLVSLIGYCMDNNYIALVYEYMQHGSLEQCLRGNVGTLPWKQRLRIAYESAQGLEYLHKMCSPPLIHRDVKASNILLATNLEAKISDFGYVRAFTGTHVSTQVVGTHGNMDPYYANTAQLTEKSDVYSFGVVLLEIITGKSPILQNQHLTDFVNEKLSQGNIESILDPNMEHQYNINSIWKVATLALKCTNHPGRRPDMPKIVMELNESLHLENSGIEMTSMVSEDTSQNSGFFRNDVNPLGGTANSGSVEMAHIDGMGLPDFGPSAR